MFPPYGPRPKVFSVSVKGSFGGVFRIPALADRGIRHSGENRASGDRDSPTFGHTFRILREKCRKNVESRLGESDKRQRVASSMRRTASEACHPSAVAWWIWSVKGSVSRAGSAAEGPNFPIVTTGRRYRKLGKLT